MKRLNTVKLGQDLLPTPYRQPIRLDWLFLKNILMNNKLELFFRKHNKAIDDAYFNNQVMSFEGYLNKKMSDFFDLNPLNIWTGATWSTTEPCYIVDSGHTYVELSGTSQVASIKTSFKKRDNLVAGTKFKISCEIKSWDFSIAPYIYLEDSGGTSISDLFGLSMGYNEVIVEATGELPTNGYLFLHFLNDTVSGKTTSMRIENLSVGMIIETITTLSEQKDEFKMYTNSLDFLNIYPLEEENYVIASRDDLYMNILSVDSTGTTSTTITSGVTASVNILKNIDQEALIYINTDGLYADYNEFSSIQVILSDILFTGSVNLSTLTPVSITTESSDSSTIDCRFQNQLFNFEIDSSFNLGGVRLKFNLPVGMSSLSFRIAIVNEGGIKYTSNNDADGSGFIVFVPFNIYDAERNNYLKNAIENKRPATLDVKIQYF